MVFCIICDICGERGPRHSIKFSRRPNDEDKVMEICDHCLDDISDYIDKAREHIDDFISAKVKGII